MFIQMPRLMSRNCHGFGQVECSQILKEVKNSQPSDSQELIRVWWIGTAIASSFPFHAAGGYKNDFGN